LGKSIISLPTCCSSCKTHFLVEEEQFWFIKIYFEDDKSRKLVETTVWGVTDKRVILKQGLVIPIERIHKLEL
jgi:hypothetical protein